ncbi:MAG: polysaccharide biosynthesis/export family protein [Pyrinomonadaceae bacterium]
MRRARFIKIPLVLIALALSLPGLTFGQTEDEGSKRINFRYSQNPKTKTKPVESGENAPAETSASKNLSDVQNDSESRDFDSRSVASKTLEVAKKSRTASLPLTEIYRVGVGDILFISLRNAPAGGSTYFTVLNDGTIDYPIAGGMIPVAGKTTDEIEEILREKVKLFENPQINVKVREHSSHNISVLGLVEKPGEKYLQREAVPLFVVRAEAIVQPKANRVTVRRAGGDMESFELKGEANENILIFPGDIVEFGYNEKVGRAEEIPLYYYIGGEIRTAGQKDFHPGLTLSQAILASGGLTRSRVKTVVIRRKNKEGFLESTEYDLNEIKNGKAPDPLLEAGDTIEVGN